MGRRLPKSSKHKKLKFVDPCYRGPVHQLKNRKLLPNEPPTIETNDQEMSKQFEEFIDLKNKAKQNAFKRKKKKKKVQKDDFIIVKNHIVDKEEPGMERKVKKLPAVIKQKKTESENQFFNRIQRMADIALAEAKVEEKYNIQLVDVDKKGNAKYVETNSEDGSKQLSEKKKEKRKKHNERKEEKKKLKKDDPEFELKKEVVPFGQVASAPPVLTAKLRKAPEFDKAGRRQLHLKNMLPSNQEIK
ncbi:hypothetical protein HNY73_013852 [Argiope bruennichi]|uniref:Coiled-coil domain-containing protein 137 n=1 Tax=Argiope bruennichi TaxID=94029 RepID=A0A8T0ERB5_ARGBR|nr:hypothetical protein HNY73_013852 [Argiope bruennichi]